MPIIHIRRPKASLYQLATNPYGENFKRPADLIRSNMASHMVSKTNQENPTLRLADIMAEQMGEIPIKSQTITFDDAK